MTKIAKSNPASSKNLLGNPQSIVNKKVNPETLAIMQYLNDPAEHRAGSYITVNVIKSIEDLQSCFDDFDDFDNVRGTVFDILVELTHDNPEYITSDSVFLLKKVYELFTTFAKEKKEFLNKQKELLN